MKKLFYLVLGLLISSSAIVSCSREDNNTQEVIKDFNVDTSTVNLNLDETQIIKISGNGDYKINQSDESMNIVETKLIKDELHLKGISVGSTSIKITDKKANTTISIKVEVTGKEFSITPNEVTININESATVKISGNGIYEIGTSNIATLELSEDKQTLKITGHTQGLENITILDKRGNQSLNLNIKVNVPSYSPDYKLSDDGRVLLQWTNSQTTEIDFNAVDALKFVTEIGEDAFNLHENLTKIVFSENLTKIGNSAFNGCTKLNTVTLPNSLQTIGNRAFRRCYGLNSITIPAGVTSIGDSAFFQCNNLKKISLGNNITHIGLMAFYGNTSLENIILPNNLNDVDSSTFEDCSSLNSVVLPKNLKRISAKAFKGCSNLTAITIPATVEEIFFETFMNCTQLKTVHCERAYPPIMITESATQKNHSFDGTALENIYIPAGSLGRYKNVDGWKEYANKLVEKKN